MSDNDPKREGDLAFLKTLSGRSGTHFLPHRRIFILWGLLILCAGILSHLLVAAGRDAAIPFIWITLSVTGMAGSAFLSRRIKRRSGVKPAQLGHMIRLWMGTTVVIFTLFLSGWLGSLFELKYLPALIFPVTALATLVSAGLFRSVAGYLVSGVLAAAVVPAILFPGWGLLLLAGLAGGGLLLIGISRNA